MRFHRFVPLLAGIVLGSVGCEQTTGPSEDPPPPPGPPVIQSFGALASTLGHGEATNLVWRVDGANIASISGIGVVTPPGEGAFNVRPHETVTYTLTVSNDHGTVEASTTIEVVYPAAVFVSASRGDDDATGDSPTTALRTLGAALGRVQGGGAIYLSAESYANEVTVEIVDIDIYGGRDPVTFFEDPDGGRHSTITAVTGIPLTVRNSGPALVEMTNVVFDTQGNNAELAALVDGATVWFRSCTLDARRSSGATGIRILGNADVRLVNCRIYGADPRLSANHQESRGVEIRDAASALISHCFVDGGIAQFRSSGVEIATTGVVRIGLSTIGAEITSVGAGNSAAAIRIHQGHPKIGGNILFTRSSGGAVQRLGISEEAADTDPSGLQYNLFISTTIPPYRNWGGGSPESAADLNGLNPPRNPLEANPNEAYGNLFDPTGAAAHELFAVGAIRTGDFHLVSPLLSGDANPAVNAGAPILSSDDYVVSDDAGRVLDIDGDRRPGGGNDWDLGADEF